MEFIVRNEKMKGINFSLKAKEIRIKKAVEKSYVGKDLSAS